MKVSQCVGCRGFPCADVKHEGYIVPEIDVKPENILFASKDGSVRIADFGLAFRRFRQPKCPVFSHTWLGKSRTAGN